MPSALFNFWNGPASFADRVSQLRTTGIAPLVPKLNAASVLDDAFVDTLDDGADSDWLFGKTVAPTADLFSNGQGEATN